MNFRITRSRLFLLLLVLFILTTVILFQQAPARAQSGPCVDPATGAACTDTPAPTCGLPGLPPCSGNPPPNQPTRTPRPRPTSTRTFTPTPTDTPTSTPTDTATATATSTALPTATVTPIPTSTPFPTPTSPAVPPYVVPISHIIGGFHLPLNPEVIQLPSWMQPDNIKVTDIEITQAIQCLHNPDCSDNSVPLYAGKATLVRAYVRLTTGPDNMVGPIGGALCYGNTGAGGCSNPIRPVSKVIVYNISDPVTFERQAMGLTLTFILPMSYVQTTVSQTLTVYANYNFEDLPSEGYYKDNYKTLTYQVQASEPIYVRYYPVQDNGFFPPALEWMKINDYVSKTYPTSEVYPSIGFPLLNKNYDWVTADPWGCPKGWHNLINDLAYMRSGSGPIAYGEVPIGSIKGGTGGCGVMGGPEAAGEAGGSSDGRIAAQEIGHTLNLPHVPGCGAGGPDMNYPKPNGQLDEFGVDPYALNVYPSSWNYDFMGYCGGGTNTWTSIYTYNEIAGLLPSGNAYLPPSNQTASAALVSFHAQQAQQFLLGSGDLSPTSAKLAEGFYLLGKDSVGAVTPDKGPYTVELQDATGKVLYSQHFDVAQMSNDEAQTQGGFQLVLPWSEGTHQVVFKYQDKVIGQVTASPNAPTVTLTSPAAGAHWGASGEQTISWTGSDGDNDPLSYLLQYSTDNGTHWNMMGVNLKDTSFTFDSSYLPGSAHELIRVIATDGLNTSQVVSNDVQVDPKAPELAITFPQEGQTFETGSPVILNGPAADLKDGALIGDKLQWSDNRDGDLGTGNMLVAQNLSAGEHTITVSATNSDGLTTTATVHITVNAPAATQNASSSSLVSWLALALLCAVSIIVILLVVLLVRSRRKPKPAA